MFSPKTTCCWISKNRLECQWYKNLENSWQMRRLCYLSQYGVQFLCAEPFAVVCWITTFHKQRLLLPEFTVEPTKVQVWLCLPTEYKGKSPKGFDLLKEALWGDRVNEGLKEVLALQETVIHVGTTGVSLALGRRIHSTSLRGDQWRFGGMFHREQIERM